MRTLVILLLALVHFVAMPAAAQSQNQYSARVIAVESWVEEWDETTQQWVRVADEPAPVQAADRGATRFERFATPIHQPRFAVDHALGRYGPFRVLDGERAELVDTTDHASPAAFEAMLRDHPGISRIDLVEAPGTRDDIANLALARKIRAAGIATHVPHGGSVRSGAVELFLAGERRTIDEGAQFAVHSWRDNFGREPGDYAVDAPENRLYLDFYEDMGMSPERARAFYDMTNSVPHVQALWLDAADMRGWITPERTRAIKLDAPRLAYLDVSLADTGPLAIGAPELPLAELAPIKLARLDLGSAFP
ncbi:alpha/beta hydrolase [Altererythrobacter arenosus]|uniref:Alpha/beta hydrolase n=1 Tax=Altererythrobacter arenosus TaxID=3032592 RepID=A0ABY8FP23_9SPHN|nr:alpha/beta hydrolase [Altererythrobacter sp. CAU 1644]WFL76015.1 alpha/beta hydrolase [Altererythrobacter sp. CAU 1644]